MKTLPTLSHKSFKQDQFVESVDDSTRGKYCTNKKPLVLLAWINIYQHLYILLRRQFSFLQLFSAKYYYVIQNLVFLKGIVNHNISFIFSFIFLQGFTLCLLLILHLSVYHKINKPKQWRPRYDDLPTGQGLSREKVLDRGITNGSLAQLPQAQGKNASKSTIS